MMKRLGMSGLVWFCFILSAGAQDIPAGAKLIAEGIKFAEGPAVARDGSLFFTGVMEGRIYKWKDGNLSVFVEKSGRSNGLAFHKDGTLYTCASFDKAIAKYAPDGTRSVFVDKVDGKPFNSINDLVFDLNGNLYFTNPIGMQQPKPGEPLPNVVMARPDGTTKIVATDVEYPNGIGISPDGKWLYVNDSMGGSRVMKYALGANGEVGKGEELIKFGGGLPDGLAIAESGNLYIALNTGAKIAVVTPEGKVLMEFPFARGSGVSNVCFGGPDMKTLYITLGTKGTVYAMPVQEPGMKPFSHR